MESMLVKYLEIEHNFINIFNEVLEKLNIRNEYYCALDDVTMATIHFDNSHNSEHAHKVVIFSIGILFTDIELFKILPREILKITIYAGLFHDVVDHKYKNISISQSKLKELLRKYISEINKETGEPLLNDVLEIIENISYSNQKNNIINYIKKENIPIIHAIRDADRIQALGYIGLQRCIDYTKSINGKIPEDVIKHCNNKLLKLYPENYIVTKMGREIAKPLHDYIVKYVELFTK